jgi:hypothetical protein
VAVEHAHERLRRLGERLRERRVGDAALEEAGIVLLGGDVRRLGRRARDDGTVVHTIGRG